MRRRLDSRLLTLLTPAILILVLLPAFSVRSLAPQESLKSKYFYKDFESAKKCRSCHPGIYEQWSQAMMSQAYTQRSWK